MASQFDKDRKPNTTKDRPIDTSNPKPTQPGFDENQGGRPRPDQDQGKTTR